MKRTIWALILGAGIELPSFAGTIYVATNGLNVSPFSTPETASTNIQAAVDIANDGDEVLVFSGKYGPASISKGITLRSKDGAMVTTVDGGNASRCLYLDHPDIRIEGFTIQSGLMQVENVNPLTYPFAKGGGIYIAQAELIDSCIIRNNSARAYVGSQNIGTGQGGGIYAATDVRVRNCLIHSNVAYGHGSHWWYPEFPPPGSGAGYGGGVFASNEITVENCTIAFNIAEGSADDAFHSPTEAQGGGIYLAISNAVVLNSVVVSNQVRAWWAGDTNWYGGVYNFCCTVPLPSGTGNFTNEPLFVDSVNGNFHIAGPSFCIDRGDNTQVTSTVDLDGGPRIINGHVDVGAYELPALPYISIDPFGLSLAVDVGQSVPEQVLEVWNGYLGTLYYAVATNVDWLSVQPLSGSSTGEHDFISVSVVTAGLAAGAYTGLVTVSSTNANNSPQTCMVSLDVLPRYIMLSTNRLSLSLKEGQSTNKTFDVWNNGVAAMDFEYWTDASWLTVQPAAGSSTGEHVVVTATINAAGLAVGSYTGRVAVTSTNANNSPKICTVTLSVLPRNILLNKSLISLQLKEERSTNQTLEVWGDSPLALDYSISPNVSWLSVDPTSGSSTGEHDVVSVGIDTAGLAVGIHTGLVTISSANAGNSPQICTVSLAVLPRHIVINTNRIAVSLKDGRATNLNLIVWGDCPAALDYVVSNDAPWLTVQPASGTSTGEQDVISVGIDTTGLEPGSYTGLVTVAAANAGNSPQTCTVALAVAPLVLDHFAWSAITSPQHVDAPFMVGLTAQDAENLTVFRFTNTVSIVGLRAGGVVSSNISIGSETTTAIYPMGAAYHDQRTQVIYLPQEIGSACSITSLALNVTTISGQPLTNWTIRLKHSSLNAYPASPVWEDSGWVTVYQANEPSGSTGWRTFLFGTPFEYNGTDSLIVDFSFNNASLSTDGRCQNSDMSVNRSITCRSNSSDGDPLSWSGTTPSPSPIIYVPNIRLGTTFTVPIAPWSSANFAGGVWNGTVAVNRAVANMFLQANDGAGHLGNSANFSVIVPIADADGDSLPDDWEQQYYGGATNANPSAMASNGANTIMEAYLAGLDPTDSNSFFKVFSDGLQPSHKILYWPWASNRMYSVYWTSNLLSPQTWVLMTETAGGSYTDAVHEGNSGSIYKIKVRQ